MIPVDRLSVLRRKASDGLLRAKASLMFKNKRSTSAHRKISWKLSTGYVRKRATIPKSKRNCKPFSSFSRVPSSKLRFALYGKAVQPYNQDEQLIPQTYWDELFERAFTALDNSLSFEYGESDLICFLDPLAKQCILH